MRSEREFLPAAGRDLFLPLYDALTKLLGFDAARTALVDQAALQPHHRVLDVGCGTGTLAVLIKRTHPDVDVVGLDPDPRALTRARRKAERAGVTVRFDQGFSQQLGYAGASFDRVVSSLMFHHLAADAREPTLREIYRVLKPGGRLELLDFAGPGSAHGAFARLVHSHGQLRDNDVHRVLALMRAGGFTRATSTGHRATLFGRLEFYQAPKD